MSRSQGNARLSRYFTLTPKFIPAPLPLPPCSPSPSPAPPCFPPFPPSLAPSTSSSLQSLKRSTTHLKGHMVLPQLDLQLLLADNVLFGPRLVVLPVSEWVATEGSDWRVGREGATSEGRESGREESERKGEGKWVRRRKERTEVGEKAARFGRCEEGRLKEREIETVSDLALLHLPPRALSFVAS